MTRWFYAFSGLSVVFLLPCLPLSSYFLYRKIKRECRRRRKELQRREKDIAKAAKYRQMREAAKEAEEQEKKLDGEEETEDWIIRV